MYKEYEGITPVSDDLTVRRYMSMSKFLSIIENNSLFFPSLHLLAKEDQFEGLFNLVDHPLPGLADQFNNDSQRTKRKHCFVNCWNQSIHESYALWKIYLDNSKERIAIETTSHNLKNCFRTFPKSIYIGKIQYTSDFSVGTSLFAATTKRSQFRYEEEIRVVYLPEPHDGDEKQSGYDISIDLQILFGQVVTSPFAPSWFHPLVRAVMDRYGYSNVEVKRSSLSADPG